MLSSVMYILYIGKLTYLLSTEIMCMSSRRLSKLQSSLVTNIYTQLLIPDIQPNNSIFTDTYDVELEYTATNVLDSWRGESVQQLLDIWIVILEDPVLLIHTHVLIPSYTGSREDCIPGSSSNSNVISIDLKLQLKNLCGYIFKNLYTCVLFATLAQCNSNEEEEEEEEEARIYESHLEQLIMNICVIGRYNYVVDMSILYNELMLMVSVCNQCSNTSTQIYIPFILEILRVTIMFSTHLCTYVPLTDDPDPTTDLNNTTTNIPSGTLPDALIYRKTVVYNEEHSIPFMILDAVLIEKPTTTTTATTNNNMSIIQLHGELVTQVYLQLLSLQCSTMTTTSSLQSNSNGSNSNGNASHTLFSPLIVEWIYKFYEHYLCIYLCGSSNTADNNASSILSQVHNTCPYALNTVIDGLLQCLRLVIQSCPHENDLLCTSLQWLNNSIRIPVLVQAISNSASYRSLLELCMSNTVETMSVLHKLPMLTLVTFMECIGNAVIKVQPADFIHLCQQIYQQIEMCYNTVITGASNRTLKPALLKQILHVIILLLGVVR